MTLRRTWAVARKESIHVIRDPRSLGMAIAMPLVLLLIFGYALTLDVDRVPMVVWDQSGTHASREFLSRFAGSRYFAIRRHVSDYSEVERAIDTREALLALVIPSDFASQIDAGRDAVAQLIIDGSDANTATIANGYAGVVAAAFSQEATLRVLQRVSGRRPEPPVDLRPRSWFNDDMESRNFIVPGLIAVIMMIIAALLTSLTVAREWERGTMEQLISTPIKGSELVAGKLAPYFAIGMLDVLLAVLAGEFLFKVPLHGSLLLLFLMSAVYVAGTLSMGVLISILAKNQLMANQLAMMTTFVPAFLLSGLLFAISNMPKPIQVVTHLVPARYFVTLIRGIYLKGVGLEILGVQALFLVAFGAVMILLANAKFRKKLT